MKFYQQKQSTRLGPKLINHVFPMLFLASESFSFSVSVEIFGDVRAIITDCTCAYGSVAR